MATDTSLRKENIYDQQNDLSFKQLYNIISKITNKRLLNILDNLEIDRDAYATMDKDKYADNTMFYKFPLISKDDVILSKIYFDFQKDKYPDSIAIEIADKINFFLDMYDIPDSLFVYATQVKTASSKKSFYLLPDIKAYKVTKVEDLEKHAEAFVSHSNKMSVSQKITFAENFAKIAYDINYTDIPPQVKVYLGVLPSDLQKVAELIEYRASISMDKNQKEKLYKIAEDIRISTEHNQYDLIKLAEVIQIFDNAGKYNKKLAKHIPDAISTVFNKFAEEDIYATKTIKPVNEFEHLTKADIIARFGDEALEAIEDEEGKIDLDKLNTIVKAHDATKQTSY